MENDHAILADSSIVNFQNIPNLMIEVVFLHFMCNQMCLNISFVAMPT